MDSFLALSAQKGLEGPSISELAASAKISKPSFYSHFPSRDALRQASIDQALRALDARDLKIKLTPQDPQQNLFDCFNLFWDMFSSTRTSLLYRIIRGQRWVDSQAHLLNRRIESMAFSQAEVVLEYLDQRERLHIKDLDAASHLLGLAILDLLDRIQEEGVLDKSSEDSFFSEAESFIERFCILLG
jgi:AcrR family transcriptional regulator